MPCYYFHISNGSGFTEDHEGQELANPSAARAQALKDARAVMARDLRSGELDLSSFIEVEDAEKCLLFTLTFEEAVTLKRTAEQKASRHQGGSEA